MTGRILGAIISSVIFGIAVPIGYAIFLPSFFESFYWFFALIGLGVVGGAILGYLVPAPFCFLAEAFLGH